MTGMRIRGVVLNAIREKEKKNQSSSARLGGGLSINCSA